MEIYFHVDHPERILFTGPAFSYWVTSDYGKTYTRVRHAMQHAAGWLCCMNLALRRDMYKAHISMREAAQEGVHYQALVLTLQCPPFEQSRQVGCSRFAQPQPHVKGSYLLHYRCKHSSRLGDEY